MSLKQNEPKMGNPRLWKIPSVYRTPTNKSGAKQVCLFFFLLLWGWSKSKTGLRVIPSLTHYSDLASDTSCGKMQYFWTYFWHIFWHYGIPSGMCSGPRPAASGACHGEKMPRITTSWQRKRKRKRRRKWRRRSCTFLKSRDPHLASGEQHLETLDGQTINQNIKRHLKSINQSTNQPTNQSINQSNQSHK